MVKIWDKKEQINGINAETILANREDLVNEKEVILIVDDNTNRVTNIEIPSIICSNLGLDNSLPALEIGQKLVEHITEQNTKAKQNQVTVEDLKTQLETANKSIAELTQIVTSILTPSS